MASSIIPLDIKIATETITTNDRGIAGLNLVPDKTIINTFMNGGESYIVTPYKMSSGTGYGVRIIDTFGQTINNATLSVKVVYC